MGFYHNFMSMFYHSLYFLKPQEQHNNTAKLCTTVAYRSFVDANVCVYALLYA